MTEQQLIKKFNNLKEIKPDLEWKKANREILFCQISASRPILTPKSNLRIVWESIRPAQILINLAKPVWLTSAAGLIIMVAGLGGVYGSKNAKPGDSLYMAKIISEKTQFAMTFNEKNKAKLNVEFAANRAKEMKLVLNDAAQSNETNNDKLKVLSQDFKKEIKQVKKRLTSIKSAQNSPSEEAEVFGANLSKDNKRMEISEPAPLTAETGQASSTAPPIINNTNTASASSTVEIVNKTDEMLDRAEKLFDEKNLDGTIGALEEVSKAIEEDGQVKGLSETATSTEGN